MYDELIQALRDSNCASKGMCGMCPKEDMPCIYRFASEAADAIEELSVVVRAQKAVLDKFPKWIPVTERLPEDGEFVLAWKDEKPNGFACICMTDKGGWRFKNITHWMPLPSAPEPPKEE